MICLKIRTFVVSATTIFQCFIVLSVLWFAWKFVPLWYQQQPGVGNSQLTGVVICLKIRTFVVSATTDAFSCIQSILLWFAWKFVPLWYQQQHRILDAAGNPGCDLLENSYLCGISNNERRRGHNSISLWFAWKFVPLWYQQQQILTNQHLLTRCDLLENSHLCGISNNLSSITSSTFLVVICLKIRTFVVSATTLYPLYFIFAMLWFAWKFVPLWYQQQQESSQDLWISCCDLLENSYLCGISNNWKRWLFSESELWFAWKFVPLWYQQQPSFAT